MRNLLIVLSMLLCSITSAAAQVSVGIGSPGVSIGIDVPVYPELVPVPGYPVYYAPQLNSNYFFYDGMYWVYQRDRWYASTWYNGPWELVSPDAVPLFILRVPVRYYREAPAYFRGWASDAPPRWGDHWGNEWEKRRSGWDNWNRSAVPAPAPLPVYQRQYSGNRYPPVAQQQVLQSQNYRYQPQDAVVQQHYQTQQRPQGVAQRQAQRPAQAAAQHQAPQPPQAAAQREKQVPQAANQREKQVPQVANQREKQPPQAAAQRPTQQRPQATAQREKQAPQAAAQREKQAPQAAAQRPTQQRPQATAQREKQTPQAAAQREKQVSKSGEEKG